ncbi:MAG: SDR family oxidoreductase [Polyangiaceae bacterium]
MREDLLPAALAGGTGFTGRRVARRLVERGAVARALVRTDSDTSVLPGGVETVCGDLDDPTSLDAWLRGCRSLVYVASMGFGQVPGVLSACRRMGIRRAVFVSTTAIFTYLPAPSKTRRKSAEAAVMDSDLAWTIVRPTMIYGAPGDRNIERLLRAVSRWPLIPVPGNGRSLLQPIHVEDLAAAIVAAWESDTAVGKTYEVSGAAPLSFDATIDAAAQVCGRRAIKVHLPIGAVAGLLKTIERAGVTPRIKSEQVLRLAEDKAFAHDAAGRDFGFHPRAFVEGIKEEARQLGLGR